jgi:hypothetical protein
MRILLACGLAASLCAKADATVKIGYQSIPGELSWVQHTPAANLNKDESTSQGVITFAVDSMRQLTPCLALGISVGAGLPAGDIEFERTEEYTTLGGVNPNEGDNVTAALTSVPILARLSYSKQAGPGEFSLGLGAGAVLVGIAVETVETWWWDGMAPSVYKSAASDVKMASQTENSVDFAALLAVEMAPGYSLGISEKDSIGIEIPLAFLAGATLKRIEMDYEPPFVPPGDSNPTIGGTWVGGDTVEYPGIELGGFSWGVNIVYTRKF